MDDKRCGERPPRRRPPDRVPTARAATARRRAATPHRQDRRRGKDAASAWTAAAAPDRHDASARERRRRERELRRRRARRRRRERACRPTSTTPARPSRAGSCSTERRSSRRCVRPRSCATRPRRHGRPPRRLARLDGDLRRSPPALSRVLGLVREVVASYYFGAARQDQRVHGRVPDPEPRSRARRGRRALVGVRPRLQRPAGEGRAKRAWRVASTPLLADAARADGADGDLHPRRAVGDRHLRQPGARQSARGRPLARALPDRHAARCLRHHRRDPQQLRPLHRAGDLAGVLEHRDHRRARDRRAAGADDEHEALRLRVLDPDRDVHPGAAADAVAARLRATAACRWCSTGATRRSSRSSC